MKTTPTTDRGRATLTRIIDAACELFYRQGVAATGLNEIIEASGTGKGQLYFFFEDKADLVLAVIAAQIERVVAAGGSGLDDIETADDLRQWCRDVLAAHREHGPARCPLGGLVVELADSDPDVRAALDDGFAQWRDTIAVALARLQDAGEVDTKADAADLAETFLCVYEGGMVLSEVRGTTRPLELSLTRVIESLIAPARAVNQI